MSDSPATDSAAGFEMHELLRRLFPICRSITGDGVRQTLRILAEHIPLQVHEVATGTTAFDWQVPQEWNIRDAFIANGQGTRVVDFHNHNLHVVGYSTPVDKWLSIEELQEHLYSLPEQPDAIPYITSYYKERWGFCLSHNQRLALSEERYRVVIDSGLTEGSLTYGEYAIPGADSRTVFLSTYVCHPSMANNELSGPVVATFLAKWLASAPRKYTYRIAFVPETIGSIVYLSRHHEELIARTLVGFNLSCVGDEGPYSVVSSRYANSLADRVTDAIFSAKGSRFKKYSYLERGSDERQYCAPGVDLPLVTICRSKYGTFPEYHTSLDNLEFVTAAGLADSLRIIQDCIELVERNKKYRVNCKGEPQLGKRGLYPDLSTTGSGWGVRQMMNFIAYADGRNDLIDIANLTHVPVTELYEIADKLCDAGLLDEA